MSKTSLLTAGAAAVTALANSVAQRTASGTLVVADAAALTEAATLAQVQAEGRVPFTNQLTGDYTLALGDEGKALGNYTAAASLTVTLPTDTAVPFPLGGFVDIVRWGAQNIVISPGTGVQVVWHGQAVAGQSIAMSDRFTTVRLVKIGATSWLAHDLSGPADTGWVQVTTLATGFSPGSDAVHYRVKAGVCHFRMHVIMDSGTRTGLVYTFPATARPTQLVWFIATASGAAVAELKLTSDGALTMGGRTSGNTAGAFVASGSFPIG